ncbi:hypothetical protein [Acetivibrio cellulolyticus]|uniref:hypothetical protein n=1 Tax=Acetivibrio cellulolyticus TaxID=35830 RepID=UPI0001E2C785|nr:hypothetical protein [Acetivibrio cellulolyticus]
MKTKLFTLLVSISSILAFIFPVTAFAEPKEVNPFKEVAKYIPDDTTTNAVHAVSPIIAFFAFVVAVVSLIIIIFTIFSIVTKAGKVKTGKDSFSKKWIGETALVLILCLVFGGVSGFRIMAIAKDILIDTAITTIEKGAETTTDESGSTSSEQSQKNNQYSEPNPSLKPE